MTEKKEESKTHYFLQKMQEKKCKTFNDNQRILQKARMERDNMLKDAREIKEK
jgi:hypothetical protein